MNICILGGGHGTSRLVKGFNGENQNIDIIVTSSDNGSHTGEIIKEFDVPGLGDLRMVLESLLNKPLIDFFSYRFKNLHGKENVSLGNLILLSILLEYDKNVLLMLDKINSLINENYHLHLANHKYIELKAERRNGDIVVGESDIGEVDNIKRVYFENEGYVSIDTLNAIENADIIVLSFGSFYTSLGAVLANEKIREAISESKAKIIYIPNLVNQKETKGYVLEDYVDYIEKIIKRRIDKVIVSNNKIKRKYVKRYQKLNREIVIKKEDRDNYYYYPLLEIEDSKLRHNVKKLVEIITSE